MEEKNGSNKVLVIIVLLIVNIAIVGYIRVSLMRQLDKKSDILVNSLTGQINSLENSISYLDYSISERVKSALDERNNTIVEADYKYNNINPSNGKVSLDFNVRLRTVNTSSKIYMEYNGVDGNREEIGYEEGKGYWEETPGEIELERRGTLSYGGAIELIPKYNYQYNIIEKTANGDEILLNSSKQYIYLYDELYKKRIEITGSGSGWDNEKLYFDFSFSVDDLGEKNLGLDKALIEIYFKGQMIDKIDVTNEIGHSHIRDLRERYNIAVASGQIDPHTDIEDFIKDFELTPEGNDSTKIYYTYTHQMLYETEYPELKLSMNNSSDMYVNLIITCKDGYSQSSQMVPIQAASGTK